MFPLSLAGCTRLKGLCRSIGYSFYSSDNTQPAPSKSQLMQRFKKTKKNLECKRNSVEFLKREETFEIIYQQVEKFVPTSSYK